MLSNLGWAALNAQKPIVFCIRMGMAQISGSHVNEAHLIRLVLLMIRPLHGSVAAMPQAHSAPPVRQVVSLRPKSPTLQTGSGEAVESKPPGVQTGSSSGGLCARWGEQIEQ